MNFLHSSDYNFALTYDLFRNATKRWKQAQSGQKQDTGDNSNNDNSKPASALRQQKSLTEPLSVVIVKTSMNLDQQKQVGREGNNLKQVLHFRLWKS